MTAEENRRRVADLQSGPEIGNGVQPVIHNSAELLYIAAHRPLHNDQGRTEYAGGWRSKRCDIRVGAGRLADG